MLHRSRTRVLFALLAALLALALFGPFSVAASAAGSCRVPSQYASIQAAVDDPACSDVEVEAGTYYENVVINRDVNIQGDSRGDTIVDGGEAGHVFYVSDDISASLSRLVIQNGAALDCNSATSCIGGGIRSQAASLRVTNVVLRSNEASLGGGIGHVGGALVVSDTTVTGNQADVGAGILARGQVTVRGSLISANTAQSVAGGMVVAGGSTTEIAHSVIRDNRAPEGGGVVNANYETEMLIFKSQVTHNHADIRGGGIINAFGATLTLKHSEVLQNTAGEPGSDLLNIQDATTIINRSTVGDVYNEGGTIVR